jgi:conjugative transfer signal peptidase TraF
MIRNHPKFCALVLFFACALAAGLIDDALKSVRLGYYRNLTDSVPIGIYKSTQDSNAPYVAFCLSADAVRKAQSAGFIIGKGTCPGGFEPLLKPFFRAAADNKIMLSAEGVFTQYGLLKNSKPKPVSSTGKPLDHYPYGVYRSGIWVVSDYNPNSYDSRYFGPIPESAIQFYAEPVFVKEKRD